MTGDNSILFSLLGPGSSKKTVDLPLTDAATVVPGEETVPEFADLMEDDFGSGSEDPAKKKSLAENLSDAPDVDEWVAPAQQPGIGDQKPVVVVEEGRPYRAEPMKPTQTEAVRTSVAPDERPFSEVSRSFNNGLQVGHDPIPQQKELIVPEKPALPTGDPATISHTPSIPKANAPEEAPPGKLAAEKQVPHVSAELPSGSPNGVGVPDPGTWNRTDVAESAARPRWVNDAPPGLSIAQAVLTKSMPMQQGRFADPKLPTETIATPKKIESGASASRQLPDGEERVSGHSMGRGIPVAETQVEGAPLDRSTPRPNRIEGDITFVPAQRSIPLSFPTHANELGSSAPKTTPLQELLRNPQLEDDTLHSLSRKIDLPVRTSVRNLALSGSTVTVPISSQLPDQLISVPVFRVSEDADADLPFLNRMAAQAHSPTGSPASTGSLGQVSLLQPPPIPGSAGTISVQIAQSIENAKHNEITVRLDPKELGTVRLILSPRESGLHVAIFAERQETLDLLRRESDDLATSLGNLGMEGNPSFQFDRDDGAHFESTEDPRHEADRSDINLRSEPVEVLTLQARTDGLDLRI